MKIEVVVGNIVKQPDVEAVVNSANAHLRLGSGVAGAIHTAAGPKLEEHCKPFAPLTYGVFLVTPGFNLPNLWVIHVRAASYTHHDDAPAILEQALQAAIQGAHQNDIRTMALPAIGTGVFAFPPMLAAQITAKVFSRKFFHINECITRITTKQENILYLIQTRNSDILFPHVTEFFLGQDFTIYTGILTLVISKRISCDPFII